MDECVSISAGDFAKLSQEEKDAVQKKQAECLRTKALAGVKLSESETQYLDRQEIKPWFGTPPAQTGFLGLFVANVEADAIKKTETVRRLLIVVAVIAVAYAIIRVTGLLQAAKG